jgi:hypothetical protein
MNFGRPARGEICGSREAIVIQNLAFPIWQLFLQLRLAFEFTFNAPAPSPCHSSQPCLSSFHTSIFHILIFSLPLTPLASHLGELLSRPCVLHPQSFDISFLPNPPHPTVYSSHPNILVPNFYFDFFVSSCSISDDLPSHSQHVLQRTQLHQRGEEAHH